MLTWLLGTAVDLALNNGWLAGLAGGLSGLVGFFTRGWLRWLLLAAAVAAVGFWIMGLKLTIARQETAIVQLAGEKLRLQESLQACGAANQTNAAVFERQRATHRAAVAALEALLADARRATLAREKVHVAATACSGVPPAGRALADLVRERQAAAAR